MIEREGLFSPLPAALGAICFPVTKTLPAACVFAELILPLHEQEHGFNNIFPASEGHEHS